MKAAGVAGQWVCLVVRVLTAAGVDGAEPGRVGGPMAQRWQRRTVRGGRNRWCWGCGRWFDGRRRGQNRWRWWRRWRSGQWRCRGALTVRAPLTANCRGPRGNRLCVTAAAVVPGVRLKRWKWRGGRRFERPAVLCAGGDGDGGVGGVAGAGGAGGAGVAGTAGAGLARTRRSAAIIVGPAAAVAPEVNGETGGSGGRPLAAERSAGAGGDGDGGAGGVAGSGGAGGAGQNGAAGVDCANLVSRGDRWRQRRWWRWGNGGTGGAGCRRWFDRSRRGQWDRRRRRWRGRQWWCRWRGC